MKKNIAIIIQKLNGGGAERTASNLSIILKNYCNVHLIVFDGRNIKYPIEGTLHDLHLPATGNFVSKVLNAVKRVRLVKKIKQQEKIDTSISLMDGANLVNAFSRNNDKVITSIRIQMSKANSRLKNGKLKKIELIKMRLIEKKSNMIVSLSNGVENDLIENFSIDPEKIITIYNPCDGELLKRKALTQCKTIPEMDRFTVTTMGRFTSQKGQWHLIRAFSKVVKTITEAKLYILGEGPLEEKLRKLTKELKLDKHVIFTGYIEAPHAYIMNSRLFVLPSLFEGLGNVQIEAMACGVPCISSDCFSGPREILAPGTEVTGKLNNIEYAEFGVLISVCDDEHFNATDALTEEEVQMADAIIEMLSNNELYLSYKEKVVIRAADFSPENIAKKWLELL